MFQLKYLISLDSGDAEFWMQETSIKRLFLAYDELQRDHPDTYIRVLGIILPNGTYVK